MRKLNWEIISIRSNYFNMVLSEICKKYFNIFILIYNII